MDSPPTPLADALGALEQTQRDAVLAEPDTPLLISAGAGSGKTRVLTMRIAALLERHGVRAEQVLALTFTKKACGEMQERVARLCPQIAKHALTVKTFHSFCFDIVREHHARLNFPHEPSVIDAVGQADVLRECIQNMNPSKKHEISSWKPDEHADGVVDEDAAPKPASYSSSYAEKSKGMNNAIKYFVAWLHKSALAKASAERAAEQGGGGGRDGGGGGGGGGSYSSGGAFMQDDDDMEGHRGGSTGAQSAEEELKMLYDRQKKKDVKVHTSTHTHTLPLSLFLSLFSFYLSISLSLSHKDKHTQTRAHTHTHTHKHTHAHRWISTTFFLLP